MGETQKALVDDATLIARARAGEAEAFGELYGRYFDSIYRYLRSRVEEDRDAEDLAENVFLRALQSLGRYRERGWPFSAFLNQVAKNALADHYRQRREEEQLSDADAHPTAARELDDQVARSEDVEAIRRALSALPPDYQEVIRLRVQLGMSTQNVASWMRRSEGAVRILLFRALERLRQQMNDERQG